MNCFWGSEEAGRTVSLPRKEKQIQNKRKRTFSAIFFISLRRFGLAWLYIASSDDFANHHPKGTFGAAHLSVAYITVYWREFVDTYRFRQKCWHHSHACKIRIKKVMTLNPSIQINFGLHHYLSYDKIFQTRSHLPIFAQRFFLSIFLMMNT